MSCSAGKCELIAKGIVRWAVTSQTRDTVLLCLGKKSRAGLVTSTKVIHIPVITRQVCSDKTSPRSSWKVRTKQDQQGKGQGMTSLPHSSGKEQRQEPGPVLGGPG